ncbi:MAG: HAD-IA family hydrolase [Paracoccaceae bacterium]
MDSLGTIDTIVWDFDGVLNRNFVDGRYLWQDGFTDAFGHEIEIFCDMIFNDKFHEILTGEMSLLDALSDWAATVGYQGDLRNLIEFWFQNDYHLDDKVMGWLAASRHANIRNVLGTNNDPMRTQFIAEDLGFSDRMERVFSSGNLGVAKPDEGFFDKISDTLSVEPDALLLIDDTHKNCEAAEACGWHAHWFDGKDYAGLEAKLHQIGALG